MAFLQEYEKLRLIGKGAFASVYKVRHSELGYVRALKVSHEDIEGKNDKAWKTFLEECKMLLRIGNGSHPNIVRIYQPRLLDGKAAVEMDYVDGISLSEYVENNRFIPFSEFKTFAQQIVGALAYCHVDIYRFMMEAEADCLTPDPSDGRKFVISPEKEQELIAKYGVIHNDLHSNNIMRRDYDGQYVLLDFGLSIQDNHCVKSSSRGDGAIEYTAPEKLEQNIISPQSDVYALGILMFEFLAGQVPFQCKGNTPESARAKVYMQHLTATPPDLLTLRRQAFENSNPNEEYSTDLPEGLSEIVMKCLAKDPAQRFASAKELQKALEECFAQTPEEEQPKQHKPETKPESENSELSENLLKEIKLLRANLNSMRSELTNKIDEIKVHNAKITEPITKPIHETTPPPPPTPQVSKGRKFLIGLLYCITFAITAFITLGTYYSVDYYVRDETIPYDIIAFILLATSWIFKPKRKLWNLLTISAYAIAVILPIMYIYDTDNIIAILGLSAISFVCLLLTHKLRYKSNVSQ